MLVQLIWSWIIQSEADTVDLDDLRANRKLIFPERPCRVMSQVITEQKAALCQSCGFQDHVDDLYGSHCVFVTFLAYNCNNKGMLTRGACFVICVLASRA